MKRNKKVLSILLSLSILILSYNLVLKVNANNTLDIVQVENLETMSKNDCEDIMIDLLIAIINNDTSFMYKYIGMFTSDCYDTMYQYISSNDINSSIISNMTLDFTYPDNSSTGDSVMMLNTKVWYDNQSYNLLYLFEFHINSAGDIYGFNVWTY